MSASWSLTRGDVGWAVAVNVAVFGAALWVLGAERAPTPESPVTVAVTATPLGGSPASTANGPTPTSGTKRGGRRHRPRPAVPNTPASEVPSEVPSEATVADATTPPRPRRALDAVSNAQGEAEPAPGEGDPAGTEEGPPPSTPGTGVGEGTEGGAGDAAGDPAMDRAVAFYRARLVAWFSTRFRVRGSGLSARELLRQQVKVEVRVDEARKIAGYRIVSSSHVSFETAARTTLDDLIGVELPAPPEAYPGAVQDRIVITFRCVEGACS